MDKRQSFLRAALRGASAAAGIAAAAFTGSATAQEPASAPNIVYILADDLGYGDIERYNPASRIETPNLNRLCDQGMMFTDAHSPSAVCSPTRYGILTGRYSWRGPLKQGVTWSYNAPIIESDRPTVASMLQDNGYNTACIGKWHLGLNWTAKPEFAEQAAARVNDPNDTEIPHEWFDFTKPITGGPTELGFDYFYGINASLDIPPYFYIENDRMTGELDGFSEGPTKALQGGFWRHGPVTDNFDHRDCAPHLTEKAVAYIEAQAPKAEPFFLYFPLTGPHTPWIAPEFTAGKSGIGPYGDMVMMIDWIAGEIMDALERTGEADNTLLIFTSDNGAHWPQNKINDHAHRSNHYLRGQKADIWEAGHRVPFIVRWPGRIEAGSVEDATICHTDLFATVADLTDSAIPEGAAEDSYSIAAALRGEAFDEPIRPAVVHHSLRGMFAVRQGPWKYIEGQGSGGFTGPNAEGPRLELDSAGQLYNLHLNPAEAVNYYDARPEILAEMKAALDAIRNEEALAH
jgi:arylsulfatase A